MTIVNQYIIFKKKDWVASVRNFTDVDIDKDLDNIMSTFGFSIPYPNDKNDVAHKIEKFTYVEYWVKPINGVEYVCKFRGYIDTISKSLSKTDRKLSINCLDKLSLFDRIEFTVKISIKDVNKLITNIVNTAYKSAEKASKFDNTILIDEVRKTQFVINTPGSIVLLGFDVDTPNLINYLREIRDKSILYIYYRPEEDRVYITNPRFLQYDYKNDTRINVWDFDSETNLFESIDYGEVTANYNEVHVIGNTTAQTGIARDVLAQVSNPAKIYTIHNYSGAGVVELDRQAADILLDMSRNYRIQIKVPFIKEGLNIRLGDMITINDHDKLSGWELFIVRKITYTASKDDVIISIQASASSIIDIPEKFIIDTNMGITSPRLDKLFDKNPIDASWNEVFDK